MATDTAHAAREDDLDHAVDYAAAARRVAALAVEGRFKLVETLAEHVAQLLLHEFPIARVRVEIEKPAAITEADSVGVSIERRKRVARELGRRERASVHANGLSWPTRWFCWSCCV